LPLAAAGWYSIGAASNPWTRYRWADTFSGYSAMYLALYALCSWWLLDGDALGVLL